MKKNNITRFYNNTSKKYEGKYYEYITATNKDHITKINFLCKGGRVLEVGCGSGRILSKIKNSIGIDISENMLKIAKSKGCNVRKADAIKLPFKDNSFDVVYSFKVLSHIQNIEKAIKEIIRVTKPNGYMILEFYNHWSFKYIIIKKLKDLLKLKPIYSRYDTIKTITKYFSENVKINLMRGYCLIPLIELLYVIPLIGKLIYRVEKKLCRTKLNRYGGYLIVELRKELKILSPKSDIENCLKRKLQKKITPCVLQ